MASRMEKYQEKKTSQPKSRLVKNEKIYEDFYRNTSYTEFTKIDTEEVIDLKEITKPTGSRENYRRRKEYENILAPKEEQDSPLSTMPEEEEEPKVYDINSVLEEAKRRRENRDDLEKKRKLKNTEYNILEGLSKEKIAELREKKKEVSFEEEEPGLEELIHTITSNSLKQKMEQAEEEDQKDLLSDLMPSSLEETVITEAISKEILDDYPAQSQEADEIDHSFYTRSMDLTDEDFEVEDTSFVEKKPKKIWLRVLCIFIILGIIALVAVMVYEKIK